VVIVGAAKKFECTGPMAVCALGARVGLHREVPRGGEHMGKYQDTSRKFAETFNKHDLDGVAKLYAEDAVAYDPMYPEPLRGRAAIRKDAATFFRAFPDIHFEIITTIEKDDRYGADEIRMTGTHTGPLETPTGQELPPTNKRIDVRGSSFVRLNERGEAVEERRYYDVATVLRQLGVMPEPAEEPVGAKR
jgi:steroid delta-isomerase-like uncharacterized protein